MSAARVYRANDPGRSYLAHTTCPKILDLVTDDDLIDEWTLTMRASGAAENTIKLRTATLHALLASADQANPLQLTRRDVAAFLGRSIAAWSRFTYWSSIEAWCRWLDSIDVAHHDLLLGLKRPRRPSPVARPIDDTTICRLLAASLSDRARAYVTLALYGALRVHEIARLRCEDFDVDAGWMTIHGKGGTVLPVPMHPEIVRLIPCMPKRGWWFPSARYPDQPVRPVAVSHTITAALRSVGSTATAHQLRDTAATRLQREHRDIRVTQAFLRHRSVQTTQKYTAVADDDLRSAVSSIGWGVAA